eukprot:6377903-Amphidinium_carterae.1
MVLMEKLIVERLGCPILSVDVIEAATGIKITKRHAWEEDGPRFDETINDALQEASLLVNDSAFIEQLQLIFYEADLQPEFVKLIFERSDRCATSAKPQCVQIVCQLTIKIKMITDRLKTFWKSFLDYRPT